MAVPGLTAGAIAPRSARGLGNEETCASGTAPAASFVDEIVRSIVPSPISPMAVSPMAVASRPSSPRSKARASIRPSAAAFGVATMSP
jgi:hypothetical protein